MFSFPILFRANAAYVARSLRRLGVHDRDVEDVTQEVFVAVHAHLAELDESRPIKPWLFAFAFRAAANYRRLARHRHEVSEGAGDEPEGQGPAADQALDDARRAARLMSALDGLDLEHRAAIILVDLEQVAPKEAAEGLGIPLNTLYSRVRNGREKLRRTLLGGDGGSPKSEHSELQGGAP